MAGQPVLEELERKIREDKGGEEWVYDQLANGRTVGDVAEELGISRRYMYRWRDRKGCKERRKPLWEEAIRMSGAAQAERGLRELEGLDKDEDGGRRIPMSAEVQLAGSRAKYRQWLAGKYDPEGFGDRGIELSFSLGELHLQALQRPRELPVVEAELIEDDEVEVDGDPVEDTGDVAQASERTALPTSASPEPEATDDDELAELFG